MAPRLSALRATAFLLVAALGVHELRFGLADGGRGADAFATHTGGYLAPLAGVVLAAALGGLLAGLARSGASAPPSAVRIRRLWPLASAALLAIYGSQEVLEGLLATGHPGGVTALVAGGGWLAVPLALLGGAVVALAVRIADLAQRRSSAAARIPLAWLVRLPAVAPPVGVRAAWVPAGRLAARHLAGRGPPPARPLA